MNTAKICLVDQLRRHCIKHGEFSLASGSTSKTYIDLDHLSLSSLGWSVTSAIRSAVAGMDFDAIGGPCIGADPIIGAFLAMHGWYGTGYLRGFLVRKKTNGSSPANHVIGPVKDGDRCVAVDDVTTTGSSLITAINHLLKERPSCKIVHAIAIVDRQAGAAEAFAQANIPFTPIVTLSELGVVQ